MERWIRDAMTDIVDNAARSRYEVTRDGYTAELDYVIEGHRIVLLHTEVPEALGGQGIGGELVEAAVQRAARDGLTIIPRCAYARRWLEKHPDRIGGGEIDWTASA
jgi:predicted GNAT family acetyltransferase